MEEKMRQHLKWLQQEQQAAYERMLSLAGAIQECEFWLEYSRKPELEQDS